MPRTYTHLSHEDRETLTLFLNRGRSLRAIAKFLGRSHGSLSREIRRNRTPVDYRPFSAHQKAKARFSESHRRPRLPDPELRRKVEALLRLGWSPEIIAGFMKQETGRPVISHETVYQWVYAEARHLISSLVRGHKRRRHRAKIPWEKVFIPQRISVDKRPPAANSRREPGHWEADLIIGKGRSALQVAVERTSRSARLRRLQNKSATQSSQALKSILSGVPKNLRKSVTYDNGSENVLHLTLRDAFGTRSYFCAPYHSWEKGTIENTNGLVRRFLPKGTNFDIVPDSYIQGIEDWLNARPRKCLGFKSSAKVLETLSGALAG